jgi:dUTP pyrophosphatase
MDLTVEVLRKADSTLALPQYETANSAGLDARADIAEDIVIAPLKRKLIPTGLKVAVPPGYTLDVDSRSGLALKNGVFVLNAPGIVDADYRGEIGVILMNLGEEPFTVKRGDRVCQLLLRKVERVAWKPVEALSETKRGEGGFGHTGVK